MKTNLQVQSFCSSHAARGSTRETARKVGQESMNAPVRPGKAASRRAYAANWGFLLALFIISIPMRSLGVDHSPKWSGNNLTYNLTETEDPSFYVGDQYGYCRWGVLLNQDNQNTVTLDFTRRTVGPFENSTKDLFLSRSTTVLQPIAFPANSQWAAPYSGFFTTDGHVTFTQFPSLNISRGPSLNIALFRYLHFSPTLSTTKPDGTETRLSASAKKLVVLIHGWNPDSNPESYTDEFASLDTRLRAQLGAPDAGDWKLLKYHWEEDADTGPNIGFGDPVPSEAVINGTEAAEIAHLHGQHLGELLKQTCPNLESIHFIAHSAGSWAARSATKFLLSQNPKLLVQVTLLDPFIPASVTESVF